MYGATMGAYKKQREGFREQRPKTDTALGILGGLLMPMGEIGSGGGLLVKTLKGAGMGTALGALAGAGSSDAGQRGQRALCVAVWLVGLSAEPSPALERRFPRLLRLWRALSIKPLAARSFRPIRGWKAHCRGYAQRWADPGSNPRIHE